MEELEGDYITVTKEQYHQGRYDVIVKDNGIFKLDSIQYIRKLVPDQKRRCMRSTNVLILDPISNKKWKVKDIHCRVKYSFKRKDYYEIYYYIMVYAGLFALTVQAQTPPPEDSSKTQLLLKHAGTMQ